MGTIRRFEGLEAWTQARELSNAIYQSTREGEFARDFGLRDQIRRSAVSIVSNIAEGFERSGDSEFGQFLYVAKGSCGELRTQLYLAKDQGYLSDEAFQILFNQAVMVSQLVSGLIKYLRSSELRGPKFK